jgi:ABC-2 type transport system ATP-binding protein
MRFIGRRKAISRLVRNSNVIACNHLTKRFGDFLAVDDVTLDVPAGICALIGPNGAGKSTLLKMLTGLLPPDGGDVQVPSKRIMGVVPEDLGLFDLLTVEEHLELCGPIYGLDAKETRERIAPLLRILALEHGRDTFLSQCSHGMRKKTALAMALLHNPRVLFLDEPFEGIDPVSSKAIRDLLTTISGRGVVIFLTSHTLSIVDKLATGIMMIRGGRIVWSSATRDISQPLEEVYFEFVEAPPSEDLPWLRSSPS